MKRILVVGDLMVDRSVIGKMSRISPEAPAPVVVVDKITRGLGGAGNVAENIGAMGGHVGLLGLVGKDGEGAFVRQRAEELCGTHGNFVYVSELHETIVKTRVVASGQQVMRLDYERLPLSASEVLLEGFRRAVHEDVALIVISDYAKGVSGLGFSICEIAKPLRIPVFVDCRPQDFLSYSRQVTVWKPNYSELMAVADTLGVIHPVLATTDVVECATVACRSMRHMATYIVATLGEHGALSYDSLTDTVVHMPAKAQQVFDVAGAGDTFLAALACSYVNGLDLPRAVRRANLAAGVAVSRHGTAVVSRDDLDEADYKDSGWRGKLLTLEQAQAFIARRRRLGLNHRIVVTNGCFDNLHPGHIELLRWARQQGDTLVVAYNDDATVRQLKGEGRPLVQQDYRGGQLAQLDCVDCAVMFSDTDVTKTIGKLAPDILVKGAEYIERQVPGADLVARRGGDVRFAPMFGDFSTTRNATQYTAEGSA